jgi:hypothetical protein
MAIIRPAHSLIHTRSCTGKLTRTAAGFAIGAQSNRPALHPKNMTGPACSNSDPRLKNELGNFSFSPITISQMKQHEGAR